MGLRFYVIKYFFISFWECFIYYYVDEEIDGWVEGF